VAPEHLVVLETNPIFANLLRERFPAAQVLELDAQRVAEVPLEDVGTVISGLPMLAIPTPVQRRIVEGAFQLMRPGGVFVQFTYGWRAPIDREIRESLGLTWTVSHWVWRNVPPARVYRFRQDPPRHAPRPAARRFRGPSAECRPARIENPTSCPRPWLSSLPAARLGARPETPPTNHAGATRPGRRNPSRFDARHGG
jgi:hypothetical protein